MEADFTDGTAGSSTVSGYPLENAFIADLPIWYSEHPPSFPVFIWYRFSQPLRAVNVSLLAARYYEPTQFQFIGTNDQKCNSSASWEYLCENISDCKHSKQGNKGKGTACFTANYPTSTFSCYIESPKLSPQFRCLGLKITEADNYYVQIGLKQIRMWTS